jgi:hypothetical protein
MSDWIVIEWYISGLGRMPYRASALAVDPLANLTRHLVEDS